MKYMYAFMTIVCLVSGLGCRTDTASVQPAAGEAITYPLTDGKWVFFSRKANWIYYYDPQGVTTEAEGYKRVLMRIVNKGVSPEATSVADYGVHTFTGSFMKDIEEETVQVDLDCATKQRRTYRNTIQHKQYGQFSVKTAQSDVPSVWKDLQYEWETALIGIVCPGKK